MDAHRVATVSEVIGTHFDLWLSNSSQFGCSSFIRFRSSSLMKEAILEAEERVMSGSITPGTAADWLIEVYLGSWNKP